MNTLVSSEGHMTVRPPSVLVSLIKQDVAQGHAAEKAAGEPYYVAAGNKLLEAKGQMKHGDFGTWVRENFNFGMRNAQLYMSVAKATHSLEMRNTVSHLEDLSFREAIREHTPNRNFGKSASWRVEIDESIRRVSEHAKRMVNENLTRHQEREAEKKLALQLISIGFKALASKLHPDKGGTRDAMARLNRVRDRLKSHA